MSGYRSFRNWVTVGALALVSLAVALLAAPAAAAELREAPVVVPDAPTSAPMTRSVIWLEAGRARRTARPSGRPQR